jgi:hypothetical protein
MIRFERHPVELSKKKKIWNVLRLVVGIMFLASTIFFYSDNKLRRLGHAVLGVNLILTSLTFRRWKLMPFLEIDDQQIRWNNNEGFRWEIGDPDVLSWSEINRVKRLANNELMFFVENSFYRRLWLNHYPVDQQQIIIDTIKVYGERFSLHWVEEQKESAVA